MAHVRAILWQHLQQVGQPGVPAPDTDPNSLLDVADFQEALHHHADHGDLRLAASAYVRLWARTFRTLVRHARGQPERMLQLFVTDIYPYLRGTRLAARAEATGHHRARVVTDPDLHPEYVAGLIEAFVGLSGAGCSATPDGPGVYRVHYQIHAKDRAVRMAHHLSRLRIPLLLTSVLAALVGVALAGEAAPLDILAVLGGTLAAQSGANAVHDLLGRRPRHPLGPPGLSTGWLWFQLLGSYAVAGGALARLLWNGRPGILAFAAAGFVLGALYARLRDRGWGPFIAAATHGPLIVAGSAYALGAGLAWQTLPLLLPTGLMAAALLYLDDLADRPLDEAAGRRTLVVRMTHTRRAWALGAVLAAALLALAVAGWPLLWPVALLAVAAIWITRTTAAHLDDPAALVRPRALLLLCYVATAATLILPLVSP